MRRLAVLVAISCFSAVAGCSSGDEWVDLFDGKTLEGWKASENPGSFRVEEGAIVCEGPRAHLFYAGPVSEANFKNFELAAEVKTTRGSNSGIYFHTAYQQEGWPSEGYECQVLNSNRPAEPGDYVEHKMTGSLYAVRNTWKAPARDDEWFDYRIRVEGKTVRIWINEEMIVDYTESDSPPRPEDLKGRLLSSGTFALQAHDPESRVYYRSLRVRTLPDNLPSPGRPAADPHLDALFTRLGAANFPLMDLHVHLKSGLLLEDALARAREYGVTYGIALNCGKDMTLPDEESLREFLQNFPRLPESYLAMQAEGREWLDLFSKESIEKFDYVFTDAMTWTNNSGKRMRLWIKDEVEVGDPQTFMDTLVDRIEGILDNEPIDIYVNPTYVPDEIKHLYETLWTAERMDRVIQALVRNDVALEINNARRIPSIEFIRRAKAAGVMFTCGTNNTSKDDLGYMEYCLEAIEECGLQPDDMWIP